MPERDMFFNREKELAFFEQLVNQSGRDACIVHMYAGGSIGKTCLLQKIYELYHHDDNLIVTNIIDFDELGLNVSENLGIRIAHGLDEKMYQDYIRVNEDYRIMERAGIRQERLSEEFERGVKLFVESFNNLSSQKRIVLLFDTIEKIGDTDYLDTWLDIFNQLNNYVCIISGRDEDIIRKKLLSVDKVKVYDYELLPLDYEASKEFYVNILKNLHAPIKPELIDKVIFFAQGKLIIPYLAANTYSREIPPKWLIDIDMEYLKNCSRSKRDELQIEFEEQLIKDTIHQIRSYAETLILLMAHVHPLDIEMIAKFIKISEPEAKNLFDEVKQYVYVKSLPDKRIMLHDEMQRMINDYIWEKKDAEKDRRIKYSELAIGHLKGKQKSIINKIAHLSEEDKHHFGFERELLGLKAEQLKHQLIVDIGQGVNFFIKVFDEATRENQLNSREMLISQIGEYTDQCNLEQSFELIIRRIEHLSFKRKYLEGKELLTNDILKRELLPEKQIMALILLGNIEIRLAEFKKAVSYFNKAVQISNLNRLPIWHYKSLNGLGYAYRLIGDLERARVLYDQAEKLCMQEGGLEKDEFKADYGWIINNLVYVLSDIAKERKSSITKGKNNREHWKSIGDKNGLGANDLALATACYRNDNYMESLQYYNIALDIFEDSKDDTRISEILLWRALLYQDMGLVHYIMGFINKDERDKYYNQAKNDLKRAKEIGPPVFEAMLLYRFGRVHEYEGNLGEAQKSFEESFALAKKNSDFRYWIGSIGGEANIAVAKKEYHRIDEFQLKLRECMKQLVVDNISFEDDVLFITYTNFAKLVIGQNDIAKVNIINDFLKKAFTMFVKYSSYNRGLVIRLPAINKLFCEVNPDLIRLIGQEQTKFIAEKGKTDDSYGDLFPIISKWANWKRENEK